MTNTTPASSPGTRRALVHNAITNALTDAGDWVPLSVRIAATRAALAEVDAWHEAERPAVPSAVVAPPTDQTTPSHRAGLREQIAGALIAWTYRGKEPDPETGILETVRANAYSRADAVLVVLSREWPWLRAEAEDAKPPAEAAALHAAADWYAQQGKVVLAASQVAADLRRRADAELRRMADETATETPTAVDLPTLAAALDGLHTLIATSSRDWGTYRVDAWLWAVLCGWDCEETEHDDTCVHGSLEEMASRHGWDDEAVAKARRYRAAVRAVTEHQPAAGARQDGGRP